MLINNYSEQTLLLLISSLSIISYIQFIYMVTHNIFFIFHTMYYKHFEFTFWFKLHCDVCVKACLCSNINEAFKLCKEYADIVSWKLKNYNFTVAIYETGT